MQMARKTSMQIRKNDGMSITKPKTNYYKQSSNRLLFRSLKLEDIPLWMPFFNQQEYHRFLGQDISKPAKERANIWIQRQIQRKTEGTFGQLAVIEKSSDKFIGVGGIIHRELYGNHDLEITYSLLPEFWGKGYARELAKNFIDYAREETDVRSVMSMIHPENEASKKVAVANGLTFDRMAKFMSIPVEVHRLTF